MFGNTNSQTYISGMKTKKPYVEMEYENVRLSKEAVEAVREYKQKTGVIIGRFIEDAIWEKLKVKRKK